MSGPLRARDTPWSPFSAQYAPDEGRPLRGYAVLGSVYLSATTCALLRLRAHGRELPEHIGLGDLLLLGVATHKLSRLIAKDKVTSIVRAPFTKFQEHSGHGEVEEQPCGHGLRLAVGELIVCPYCLAQWVGTGLVISLIEAPRLTRALSTIFVVHTVSDFLQAVYRAAEDRI